MCCINFTWRCKQTPWDVTKPRQGLTTWDENRVENLTYYKAMYHLRHYWNTRNGLCQGMHIRSSAINMQSVSWGQQCHRCTFLSKQVKPSQFWQRANLPQEHARSVQHTTFIRNLDSWFGWRKTPQKLWRGKELQQKRNPSSRTDNRHNVYRVEDCVHLWKIIPIIQ